MTMTLRRNDHQWREQLLNITNRGSAEDLCTFLRSFIRRPFPNLAAALTYQGVIDDQIDFIDATSTKYSITPLIIAAGKGAFEKVKVLLVHGANPNKQCATGDSALNLAAHRQKCDIVNLLLEYRANPNVYNQAGKTALHRAVVSYSDENAHHVQALLLAGADTTLEDRNQRMPLDEAVLANRAEILSVLLAHDRSLVRRAYRAAIIAARLGHDKCLENLLNYGMDPDITDQTNNTPLHVSVRSSKLSTTRLLVANGADPSKANNRGETAISIARQLPLDRQANFLNLLDDAVSTGSTDFNRYTSENAVPYVHPLLRSQPNWTLDDDKYRSPTADNSSVENLLDTSSGTYWCSRKAKDAWVIFDLKHQYSISGIRVIGCNNESTPREIQLEVANAFNGPWLKVSSFTCSPAYPNKNDFFFPPLKTRFLRVIIRNNYGGDDIRVQGIGFYGVDTRLVNLLQAHGLERSLNTLLASGINDQEALDEHRAEILNSSDSYLPLNDHFRFLNLTKSLRSSQLTFLDWLDPPQTTAIAGNMFRTFTVIGDEGVTDRVKLEEQLETSPQARTVMLRDLEPIQDYSLVDFPDYIVKAPGRYKIRVVSVESPDIQTSWQEIVVGPPSFYSSKLTSAADERLYLASTIRLANDTTSDKENTSLFQRRPTTNTSRRTENRAFIAEIYESENDDTEDDTYLTSSKEIEESPYYFSNDQMFRTQGNSQPFIEQQSTWRPDNSTQTRTLDQFDQTTNTDDELGNESDSSYESPLKSRQNYCLTPTKFRVGKRRTPSSNHPTRDTDKQDELNHNHQQSSNSKGIYRSNGETFIIPTKYQSKGRRNSSRENDGPSRQRSRNPSRSETRPSPAGRQDSRSELFTPSRRRPSPSPPSRDVQRTSPQTPLDKRHKGPIRARTPTPPPDRHRRETPPRPLPPAQLNSGRAGHSQEPPPTPEPSRRRDDDTWRESPRPYIDDRREPLTRPRSPSPQNDRFSTNVSRKNTDMTPLERRQEPIRGRSPVRERSQHKDSPPPRFNSAREEPYNTRSPLPAQGFPPYQIIDGHFEIRDKSVDGSQHGQESDHSQMEVVFKATLRGQDIRGRARSNIPTTAGTRPLDPDRSDSVTVGRDENGLDQSSGFSRHPSPSTTGTLASRLKPAQADDLRLDEPAKDATIQGTRPPQPDASRAPRIYHQSGGPMSSVFSPPLFNNDTRYLNSATNSRPEQVSPDVSLPYDFGVGDKSYASDDENEEADCVAFGHEAAAKPYAGNQPVYATTRTSVNWDRQERINNGAPRQTGTTAASHYQHAGTHDYEEPSENVNGYAKPAGGGQSGAKGLASAHLGSSTTYNVPQGRPGNLEVAERRQGSAAYDTRNPSRTNGSTSQRDHSTSVLDQSGNTYENQSPTEETSPTSPDESYRVTQRKTSNPYKNPARDTGVHDGYHPSAYDTSRDDSDLHGRGTPKASDGTFDALLRQNPILPTARGAVPRR